MNNAIIAALILSVVLPTAAFAGQEKMMKNQEPTMRPVPSMKPLMTKKDANASAARKKVSGSGKTQLEGTEKSAHQNSPIDRRPACWVSVRS